MPTITERMRRKGRRRFIETYEFSPALHKKLVVELGDERSAGIALDGLRGWYLACLYADGRLIGMPSRAVDEAWHEMILMTREYQSFCRRAFGRYLHHSPDSTLDVTMDELLGETFALAEEHGLPTRLFTADADSGVDGYHWSKTDVRRLRRAAAEAEAKRRRSRRRSYGSNSSNAGGSWAGVFGFGDGGGGDGGGCGGGGCGGGGS